MSAVFELGSTSQALRLDATELAIADLVRDGVVVCAGDEVVHANEIAASMLGCEGDVESLCGGRLDSLLSPIPGAKDKVPVLSSVLGLRRECQVEVRTCEVGEWTLYVLVDHKERERPHAELLETSRDLYEARLEIASLRSRLDAEVEERRELVSVVAHELRTPITVIRGYARLLLEGKVGELNAEQAGFIQASAARCDRLDNFVEMLLSATDAQRAADAHHQADASVAKMLAGVVEFLRPLIEESDMRVELELDREALWAHFDAPRIEQVLVNLINNGLKYASSGGLLTVRTRRAPEETIGGSPAIEISVSDDGPGIAPEKRAAIFDPYVRGDTAAAVPGLGLGLAICRRIVEVHGGSITAREEPGGGCCFAFTLAAAEPKDSSDCPHSGDQ
ncbi:MAG: HAMP domain-containing sensor histidine kinase [Myxococcota bacterium]|nr:HAMP domain-containing sensor histidine kinase [Myxococcota bacterium]